MSLTKSPLPNFEKPPVVEVGLSVLFNKCLSLRNMQIASLWRHFENDFPDSEEQSPINILIEQIDTKQPTPQIQIELSNVPPVPRYMFKNKASTELIQIQQDLFAHSWRKIGPDEIYPRYEHIKKQFEQNINVFCDFLQEQKLGPFIVQQCEVTYINHIESGEGWSDFPDIGNVFTTPQFSYSDGFLTRPETFSFCETHIIKQENNPLGRLRIIVEPAYQINTHRPILKMTLVARGKPSGQELSDIMNFMDIGREWIVRSFTSTTQKTMHKIWRRTA